MSIVNVREPPERDVHVLEQQASMVDNLEVQSTASSDISESLREQILGKAYIPRKHKPVVKPISAQDLSYHTADSYEIIPSKDTLVSFEVVYKGSNNKLHEISDTSVAEIGNDAYKVGRGGSRRNISEENVIVEKESTSELSMKKSEGKNYTTIHTQTIGIQTVTIGTECKCKGECGECSGSESDSCNCLHCMFNKKVGVSDETSESTFGNCTESSSQTINVKKYSHCRCKCANWFDYDTQSTTDHLSDNSEDSYTTDFFDLPYQNNEEYLQLLRELEKKLIARNRERVRKTMLEFERRSRQNQNLDKPIFDYSDDNASLLRRLKCVNGRKSPICCRCGKNKKRVNAVNSDIMQNEKRWDELNFAQSDADTAEPNVTPNRNSSRIERSLHKSHWQLDPRSGEWIKVSCFQQTDYSRHPPPIGDHVKKDYKSTPPLNVAKKECYCRQKKRR